MIRTVALGVVCLVGLAGITAFARRPSPPPVPEHVFPTVVGNKSDRLQIARTEEPLSSTDEPEVVQTPPAEPQPKVQAPATEAIKPASPAFIPRHWHDPNELKAKAARANSTTQAKKRSPTAKPDQVVAEVSSCRPDGLEPLLRAPRGLPTARASTPRDPSVTIQ